MTTEDSSTSTETKTSKAAPKKAAKKAPAKKTTKSKPAAKTSAVKKTPAKKKPAAKTKPDSGKASAAKKKPAAKKAPAKKPVKKEVVAPEAEVTTASAETETKKAKTAPKKKPSAKKAAPKESDSEGKAAEASASIEESSFDALPEVSESFDEWDLAPPLRKALADMGYDRPMPVQQAVFQTLTAGKDLMVQSKTGSGKTSAFGIPISQLLSHGKKGVQALILAPTRELAMQVAKEVAKLVVHMDVSVVPVYGGAPIGPQIQALEDGAQIVAGTPGRVLDHIQRGTLKTNGIAMLTLDECDEMLSMGFQEEIEKIISKLPPKAERQTLLFSATIPKSIERIGRRHMNEPVMISLSSDRVGADLIDHYYYVVTGMARTRDLLKLLKAEQPKSAIIFCNTREETNTVARSMRNAGFDAEALSSDLSQADRERVMGRMRSKNLNFLVATDIAARGIDISELSHVINYTFPSSPEIYVHRTGRTGRAGQKGTALSLVGPREIGSFYYLKLIYKIDPTERDLPNDKAMKTIVEGERYQEVISKVDGKAKSEYVKLAKRLWQSSEGSRVVAVLLQERMSTKKVKVAPAASPAPVAAMPAPAPLGDVAAAPAENENSSDEQTPERGRRRRRRRFGSDQPESAPGAVASSSESTDEDTGDRKIETQAPAKEDTLETAATPESEVASTETEERPRRKRRRRRFENRDESTTEDAQTAVAEEVPQVAAQAEIAAPEVVPSEATTSEVATATPDVEVKAEEAAEAPVVEQPQAEERPRRKKRRRGYRSAEEEVVVDVSAIVPDPDATPSKASKRRQRKPRTTPGAHAEFWEAWAETKHTEPEGAEEEEPMAALPEEVKKSEEKQPAAEASPESEAPDRKRRRRRTREASEEKETNEADASTPNDHPVRLFVNVGKREDVSADEIRAFLSEAIGSDADSLGTLTLRNTHSYVRATEEVADAVIEACTGLTFKDRSVVVERARH